MSTTLLTVFAALLGGVVLIHGFFATAGCDDACHTGGPWWQQRDAWQWKAQLALAIAAAGCGAVSWRAWRAGSLPVIAGACIVQFGLVGGWMAVLAPSRYGL